MARHDDLVLDASAHIAEAKELLMQAAMEEQPDVAALECGRLAGELGKLEGPLAALAEYRE